MILLRGGCPIRIFLDQNLLAVPQDFTQRATSFIASWCQGIHRMPFCRSIFCSVTKHRTMCDAAALEPHTQPPQTRTRFTAYPPCTGTIHRFFAPQSPQKTTARNSNLSQFNATEHSNKFLLHAGKLFMQHPRSSQPQPSHHHTSEHSNFRTIIARSFRHSLGQTTHCQKPGPISCPTNADQKTSTRIQTHQNLFTLTKNIFAPPKQQDWEQTSNEPRTSPSQSNDPSPKKLDFPITSN